MSSISPLECSSASVPKASAATDTYIDSCYRLMKKVSAAATFFFTTLILVMYESLHWFSQITSTLLLSAVRGPKWDLNASNLGEVDDTPFIPLQAEPLVAELPIDPTILKIRQEAALQELKEIAAEQPSFQFNPKILNFDLDSLLAKYSPDHDPLNLLSCFTYAESGNSDLFAEQKENFKMILKTYKKSSRESVQHQAIRQNMSRLYEIFLQKQKRFQGDCEQEAALKQQIRKIIGQLIDASINCVDQVLSQTEDSVLECLESELQQGLTTPQAQLQLIAAALLFQYKANLIKTTCLKLFPNEPETADLERSAKQKIMPLLQHSPVTLHTIGAYFELTVENRIEKIEAITRAVQRRYHNDPSYLKTEEVDVWNDIEETPLAYLLREIEDLYIRNPTTDLRTGLLAWSRSHFSLIADEEKATEICQLAFDHLDVNFAQKFTPVGIRWILQSAGIIEKI